MISNDAAACLRQASERHVKAKCGADFEVYFPGNAPMGGSFCICVESRPTIGSDHDRVDFSPGFYFDPLEQMGKKKQSHYGVKVTLQVIQAKFCNSIFLASDSHRPAIAGVSDAVHLLEW